MSLVKKESSFSNEEVEILFDLIQKIRKKNLKVTYGLENLPEKNEIDQIAIVLNTKFRALSNPKDPKNLIDNIKTIFNFHNGIENKVPRYPSMRTLEAICSYYYEEFPADVYEWNDITYKMMANWKRFKEEFALENHDGYQPDNVVVEMPRVNPAPPKAKVNTTLTEINTKAGDAIPPRLLGINLLNLSATNAGITLLLSAVFGGGLFMVYNILKSVPISTEKSFSFQTEVAFVNLITIFLFILLHSTNYYGFKSIINKLEGKTITEASLKQFQGGWLGILISLFFFYAWLTAKYACYDLFNLANLADQQIIQKFNRIGNSFSDFFNLFTTFFFIYLYFILDTKSIATSESPDRNKGFSKKMLLASAFCLALIFFTALERMYDWKIFIMIYSLFSIVAMCMFFTRLNSQFLDEGSSFIPLFFGYAALQAWYPFMLDVYDIRGKFIVFAALLLKILLFTVISNYMRQGRFERYFDCMLQREFTGE